MTSVWEHALSEWTASTTRLDVFREIGYHPTPRQAEFHEATEYDVLFGGAAGGGKTAAIVAEIIRVCDKHPGLRVGAFRRTYDELNESLLKQLATFAFAEAVGATWNGTERELRFPNKSVARFRYAETVIDATRRQGGEFQLLVVDERGLMDPDVVHLLAERVRSGRADVPVLGIRSTTNPGGPGHGYLKTRFVDATGKGERVVTDAQGRTVRFIPARVDDNPHVDAGYRATLDAIPDPHRRAAMRDGDWDSFVGMAFPEWREDRIVVPAFPIPAEWMRYAGVDYGYAAPWVTVWVARDQDGRAWVYDELHATRVVERDQARRILAAEEAAPVDRDPDSPSQVTIVRAADPAMWSKTGAALPVASQYALEGVALQKANNDRINGKARVHTYMADGPACRHHRDLGWDTCPMLHITNAPGLVTCLSNLPLDPRRPEDVDTKANDHAYDALRYALMHVGTTASFVMDDRAEEPDPVRTFETYATPLDPNLTGLDFNADRDPLAGQGARSPYV